MTIILCAPDTFLLRRIMHCPTCRQRRRFSGRDQLWYGPTMTCCGCGDSWSEGERRSRPARRGWRRGAIEKARQDWRAGTGNRAAHRAWLRAQHDAHREEAAQWDC